MDRLVTACGCRTVGGRAPLDARVGLLGLATLILVGRRRRTASLEQT